MKDVLIKAMIVELYKHYLERTGQKKIVHLEPYLTEENIHEIIVEIGATINRVMQEADIAEAKTLDKISTEELIAELVRKEGVRMMKVSPHQSHEFRAAGPAVVLVVED